MKLPERKIALTTARKVDRRARGIRALMLKLQAVAPWLQETDLPVLRGFAELEYLGRRVFALLREKGLLTEKGDAKKLLGEYRMLRSAQSSIAAQLGLTPLARRELVGSGKLVEGLDLAELANAEVVDEPKETNGSRD